MEKTMLLTHELVNVFTTISVRLHKSADILLRGWDQLGTMSPEDRTEVEWAIDFIERNEPTQKTQELIERVREAMNHPRLGDEMALSTINAETIISAFNKKLADLTPEERVFLLADLAFCTSCGHEHDYGAGCIEPSECIEKCCEDYDK